MDKLMTKLKNAWGNLMVLLDGNAWALLVFGMVLFGLNVPLPQGGLVNLPVLLTLLQIAGGVFIVCAFCIVASRIFWPFSVRALLAEARAGSMPSALVLAALVMFNGLAILGFCIWLAMSFNGGGR